MKPRFTWADAADNEQHWQEDKNISEAKTRLLRRHKWAEEQRLKKQLRRAKVMETRYYSVLGNTVTSGKLTKPGLELAADWSIGLKAN